MAKGSRTWPTAGLVPIKPTPMGEGKGLCSDIRFGYYWADEGWCAMGLDGEYHHVGREPGLDPEDLFQYTAQVLRNLRKEVEKRVVV